jgi:SpoVK/Ycf46/Vps4 family AAA+-type ATPase
MDDAFLRRFNSIIYFPPPQPEQRFELLKKSFPSKVKLEKDVNLEAIAANYELTGSHIINAVQYICLNALEKGSYSISQNDIVKGVKRELEKEGR